MTILWSDVKTILDAGWNAAIIAEPGYNDSKIKLSSLVPGNLYILDGNTESIPLNHNYYQETTIITVYICSLNLTNLALYESEIKRILMANNTYNFELKGLSNIYTAFKDARADRALEFEVTTYKSYI